MDPSAPGRPLDEAADSIRRLVEYRSKDELGAAIEAVVDALERSLRLLLRSDASAPDQDRLRALAPDQLSYDEVVASLRARDRISLETAGTLHDARVVAERARTQGAQPADADPVGEAVSRLRSELATSTSPAAPAEEPDPAPADAPTAGPAPDDRHPRGVGRWLAWVGAALALVIVLGSAWVVTRGSSGDRADAVAAFRAGRYDTAAVRFERLLDERTDDVSLRLYLARSYRRLDRPAEAAEVLQGAVAVDPEDADVRRELGHLFVDLGQLRSAIRQYEEALEYAPDDPLNWAALIAALRQTADPRADELLRSAPPEVRDRFQDG